MTLKIISWNVNGIRAVLKKGFLDFVRKEKPDILCLQEIKAHPEQVDIQLLDYKHHFWNSAERKGYSGTVVFSKIQPLAVTYGFGINEHDNEGRVITLEFDNFFLVNVYTPNAKHELLRLDYRQKWDKEFLKHMKKFEKLKPIIFCGDLNVAHKEIDLANPDSNKHNPGFSDEERIGFDNYMKAGFIDTFREFNQDSGEYSWWSYRFNARVRNIGWRIDYFCISKKLRKQLKDAFILQKVMGSDHCPVGITIENT